MAEPLSQEEAIFYAALELDAGDQRAAYLDAACGDDGELRRRVEALLRRCAESAGPLDRPAGGPVATTAELHAEQLGAMIGPYKLLEPIGEGGMGTVWMAQQQEPVKRLVAVKLIKAGMDSRQVIARFEAERQALALMDHPNIAKVHDAGTTADGRPYFVMELVKGQPITKYCDEHRLTPRQRLELFVPVCQAIQHAHQKGVIHRDVKPSNVLVALYDDRPVPKVIDFGVAKATGQQLTDQTLHTGFGAVVGTVEYMSPEQATFNQLDIDTRCDVYSLGVLLYELLAGSPPFSKKELEKAGMLEMLRVIREQEPSKPSTRLSTAEGLPTLAANRGTEPAKLTKLVRGELDWIVMKALEKDRNRRYDSANGFAMDVQRYLADEAVQACPPSVGYRLKKFVRRNKGPVLAVSLVLMALVAGIVGTTWQAIRAANRAEGERLAKERAEANFAIANEAVETYLGTVTFDPELRRADFHRLRKKLLESALPFFQKLTVQKSDDPEVESGRGRAFLRLAVIREVLGETEAAIQDAEAARMIFTRLTADPRAVPQYRLGLAKSYQSLGRSLHHLGKLPEAEAAYRQAADIQEKLVDNLPAVPEYRNELSNRHNELGSLLRERGKRVEAEVALRRALDIQEKLVAEFHRVPEYRWTLALVLNNLGNLREDLGQREKAEALLRRAVEIQQKLVDEFPMEAGHRRDLAKHLHNLGDLYHSLGKPEKAEAANRQSLNCWEKLAADFPTVPIYREGVGRAHLNLGDSLGRMGEHEKAEAAYRRAVEILEKLAVEFPTVPAYREHLWIGHQNLRDVLWARQKGPAAEAAQRQVVDILKKLTAEYPKVPHYQYRLADNHNKLGAVLLGLKKRGEAEAAYRGALDIWEKLVAEYPTEPKYAVGLAGDCCNLGNLLRDSGQSEAALVWYQRAIARLEPLLARKPPPASAQPFLRNSHWGRAQALDALEKHAEATRDWERALELDDGREKDVFRSGLAFSRLLGFRKVKDSARFLAAAAEYEALKRTDAGGLYAAACIRAACAAVTQEDPKTPAADAARLAKEQADLAMAWLHKAVAAGYRNAAHMKANKDLDPLREREDFKKLVAELGAKKK